MKRRKIRRHKLRNQNKVLIISVITLTLFIGIGYAAFQTVININVKGTIKEYDKSNLYVSSSGSDVTGRGTIKRPYATIQKAYDEALNDATIYIMNNITALSSINMTENKEIIITSHSTGNTINSVVRDNLLTESIFKVSQGEITLQNIIIDGNNVEADNCLISTTSKLNINNGTIIKNGKNISSNVGGIKVENGTLNINGGTITNNTTSGDTGAIQGINSIITINNGIISSNYSEWSGAGLSAQSSTLYINGNTKIVNNECKWTGCGIALNNTKTTIDNVLIDGNKNTGSYAGAGITLTNKTELTFNNGIISNNVATNDTGGGVRVDNSTLIMNGGIIKKNMAPSNGGIWKSSLGTFTNNGGIICENTPANSYETHQACPN
ncbi:MAG: hypothetical protein IKJ43_03010 [Bacilli bacterium]|nr:hypothetical protein [Bacilli bacterium]